ncbi:MAG: bifunctional helix-turn-helix transcriptional regulator/GNAT family N-acetyltransferase [Kangiellaceae bacterium]|nr:bifunctional helix-turn-helix transcriptional regulator/GNAT family N-acetyltransferase [Kangiellaceae bacterium]
MKNLNDLGILGLGSRLKRLSDLFYRQLDEVYKIEKIVFQARNFPLLQLINENESMSVTELADVLGHTHPAISQMSKKLQQKGWIYHHIDDADERRRLLSITPAGFELFDQLSPIWKDMQVILGRLMATSGGTLMSNMELLERQLSQISLTDRMADLRRERLINSVEIIHFEPEHAEYFYQLNRSWLEKYFYVEDIDHEILSEPTARIIEPGGFILMARINEKIIGTVALSACNNGLLELSKMTVTEDYQGLGIGDKLLKAAIQQYQATDFKGLFLESNRQLTPALNLFDKYGFVEDDLPNDTSVYSRADIYMVFKEHLPQSKSA